MPGLPRAVTLNLTSPDITDSGCNTWRPSFLALFMASLALESLSAWLP